MSFTIFLMRQQSTISITKDMMSNIGEITKKKAMALH